MSAHASAQHLSKQVTLKQFAGHFQTTPVAKSLILLHQNQRARHTTRSRGTASVDVVRGL